jgi:hypothetical protein
LPVAHGLGSVVGSVAATGSTELSQVKPSPKSFFFLANYDTLGPFFLLQDEREWIQMTDVDKSEANSDMMTAL